MAPTRIRRVINTIKDNSSIGLAKVNNLASLFSDLEIAIVKATNHNEYPAEERHINIILNLTCYSTPYVSSCVKTISRRLRKTRNWVVALKALMLIHRLLHDGDVAFEQEFFFSTRYGTFLLGMSDFRDKSRRDSWDYSVFVRTYAMYLNDQLGHKVQGRKGKNGSNSSSLNGHKEKVKPGAIVVRVAPVQEMTLEQIFTRLHCLMQTLELFLNSRPTGSATTNRLVVVALYPVIKESFILYNGIKEIIDVLMERFMELDVKESLNVHEILKRVSKQFDELDEFYNWSISIGIARCSEHPEVVKISKTKLDGMEEYIQEKTKRKPDEDQNMNSIKALPPPEGFPEKEIEVKIHEVSDLIKFDDDDAPIYEENPNKLALSLFDGAVTTESSPWEPFNDALDWEIELEQSASHLSSQKASPMEGFYTPMHDYNMYHQGREIYHKEGNESIIGVPAMLALPAPPVQNATMVYPYYAAAPMTISLSPPQYVQMSEMEMKQMHQTEQQVMWQQYAIDGMQAPVAYAMMQPHPYMHNQGGYV